MHDRWDDQTESVLGDFDDKSFELDIDFEALDAEDAWTDPKSGVHLSDLWPDAADDARVVHPDLVLFDPMGFSIGEQLVAMGFGVRHANSGVEVMHQVSAAPTGAVICGPAEDAERRRLLTAAIRLRFPHIPVVYMSTHGHNPRAVEGAKAEGASIVVPLPLPPPRDLIRLLGPFAPQKNPIRVDDDGATISAPPIGIDNSDDDPTRTIPADPKNQFPGPPPSRSDLDAVLFAATESFDDVMDLPPPSFSEHTDLSLPNAISQEADGFEGPPTRQVSGIDGPPPISADFDPPTKNIKPVVMAPQSSKVRIPDDMMVQTDSVVTTSSASTNGEVGDLLRAISPFLWGLEDAARWAEDAAKTDPKAMTHARTLQLIGRLLKQLQEKIEERGL